jgi:hypothetical protein
VEKHTLIDYLMLFRKADFCPEVIFPLLCEPIKRKMNGDVKAKKRRRKRELTKLNET